MLSCCFQAALLLAPWQRRKLSLPCLAADKRKPFAQVPAFRTATIETSRLGKHLRRLRTSRLPFARPGFGRSARCRQAAAALPIYACLALLHPPNSMFAPPMKSPQATQTAAPRPAGSKCNSPAGPALLDQKASDFRESAGAASSCAVATRETEESFRSTQVAWERAGAYIFLPGKRPKYNHQMMG